MATKKSYKIVGREEGQRAKQFSKSFTKLSDAATYIKERWQGAEYIDSPSSFHTDYVAYQLKGFALQDIGGRKGVHGTDAYWDWQWFANVDLPGFNGVEVPIKPKLDPEVASDIAMMNDRGVL